MMSWKPAVLLALTTGAAFALHTRADESAGTAEVAFRLTRIDLVATDLDAMVRFYGGVFGVEFEPVPAGEFTFRLARLPGLFDLQILPREATRNRSTLNRQQLNLDVTDLEAVRERVLEHGGTLEGEIRPWGDRRALSVRDPDRNFILFTGD